MTGYIVIYIEGISDAYSEWRRVVLLMESVLKNSKPDQVFKLSLQQVFVSYCMVFPLVL